MKDLVCKICTIKLVEAAYAHAWWFRLLNNLVNPYFDRLIERLLTEREMQEAKDFAERAVRGGTEDGEHDEKHL